MPSFNSLKDAIGWTGYALKQIDRMRAEGDQDIQVEQLLGEVEAALDWIEKQPIDKGFTPRAVSGFRGIRYEFD